MNRPADNASDEPSAPGLRAWLAALFGDPSAQLSLAVHSWDHRRDALAVYWARRAARSLPLAKVFLANLLTTQKPGDAAAQAEAFAIVREAAEGGNAPAQQTLAAYYFNGEGVTRNVEESQRWCLLAAQGGQVECWISLLKYHLYGEYCDPDVEKALHYARLASEAGHPEFLTALEIDLQNEKVLSSTEIIHGT